MSASESDIKNARKILAAAEIDRVNGIIASLEDMSDAEVEDLLDEEPEWSLLYGAVDKEMRRRRRAENLIRSREPGALPDGARSSYNDTVNTLMVGDFVRMQSRPGIAGTFYVEVISINVVGVLLEIEFRKTNTEEPSTKYSYEETESMNIMCPHALSGSNHRNR